MPRWVKGQSGNPNGPPRNGGIKGLLRKHEKDAIDCLVRLMTKADSDKVSLTAAQTILAYLHGSPPEAPPAAAHEIIAMQLSEAQLEQLEAHVETGPADTDPGPAAPEGSVGNGST